MSKKKNSFVEKLTFRLFPPYDEIISEAAKHVRLSPNEFGRVATMAAADSGLLGVHDRLGRIEAELKRFSRMEDELKALRKDFNDATEE